MRRTPRHAPRGLLLTLLSLSACSPPVTPQDAAPPDAGDAAETSACTQSPAIHSIYPGPAYVAVAAQQTLQLRLRSDRSCAGTYTITSADPSVLRVDDGTVTIEAPHALANVRVTGLRAGRTRLRAVDSTPGATMPASSEIDVSVLEPTRPPCPAETRATGRLAPGATVRGAVGSPLEVASVAAPMTATVVSPSDIELACANDQAPTDFVAIGPAVRFGPRATKYLRELPFTVPVNPALVPAGYQLQVEVTWSAPSYTPRIVPVANARFTTDGRALSFLAPRLGTYQAVIRRGLGQRRVQRRFVYHAITGFSMGAIGTSSIGMSHPELFDFVMPLGGAADWGWFMHYAREFMFGGFCTAAQRAMLGDAACEGSSQARTPDVDDVFMADQSFEWWNSHGNLENQGGNFDRRSYTNIFTDLASMGGNPFMQVDPSDGVFPMGVTAAERMRSDGERCSTPRVFENYFDDEYNPDGSYPVITFCDGNSVENEGARWAGGQGSMPFSISLAVDYNRNGVRDRGEPVLRNFTEPFSDVGTDRVASADERGYDPVTNPDPAGDDYDRQYNPAGTEQNYVHDEGEPYEDVGLDGIRCPAGRSCPYDAGEGNGRFDVSPGIASYLARNPRSRLAALPRAEHERIGLWADGGVRDLFSFLASSNHFAGASAQNGTDLHYYDNFSSLIADRPVPETGDDGFVFTDVDYARLPRHVVLRYGSPDASAALLAMGDGAHVGTIDQILNRWQASTWWAQAHWPNGNRTVAGFSSMADNAGRCSRGYTCVFDFRSPTTGRVGPVAIYLPPGYHRPENASERYPVVYFLHGYGMQPQNLLATGLLIGNFMATGNVAEWQRPSKFIMVFPDGACREGDGCPRGTFYLDSPLANRGRLETYFLDLYRFVDSTFRVRAPEQVETIE